MKKLGFLLVAMIVLVSSFVLAEISVSEPLDVYNLGDRLYISADGLVGTESGNLNIDLICVGQSTNLVKIPARAFSVEESQSWSIPYKILDAEDLEIANLSQILGECQVLVSLGANVASTKTFTISDSVVVTASLDKVSYNPGEPISVNIDAVKANGDLLSGFVEGYNASDFSKVIEDGFVNNVFSMPETIEAGSYALSISAYDMGADGVLNRGSTMVSFNINQVASSIIMSLSNAEVVPGENFTIGTEVFDQSGIKMEGTVSVELISPKGEIIESAISNDDFVSIDFVSNSTPGIWQVTSSFNDLSDIRELEVLEIQKVDFDFEDSVLSITNVGNAVYNKSISVEIGEEVLELDLKIGVGEVRKFNVNAPNGEYKVTINDGESSMSRQVLLTGNAVGISDLKDVGIFKGYSIVWVFLIIVLGGVGVVLFVRYRRTRVVGSSGSRVVGRGSVLGKITGKVSEKIPVGIKSHINESMNFTNKSPKVQGLDQKSYSYEDKTMVDLTKKDSMSAESTLVLKGEKYVSAVIALSIKNYDKLGEAAKNVLYKAVGGAQKNKGLVDWRSDYAFVVFSPIVTKTYKNEALAAKVGMEILDELNAYNKKFKDKIEFNLGVHVGELIASKEKGKLKYTSIGNTISLAKRISDSDSGKLIVSDEIRKKLIRDLKVVKAKEIGGNATFIVEEVKDRVADKARLADLLKRQK